MVGLKSYANGTKQTWRGTQWNTIVSMMPGYRDTMGPSTLRAFLKDAVVVYLCGPDDYDRQCALKRGFRNENIIAVDVEKKNIDRVRACGGLGVVGHLTDIIAMWSPDIPVAAIVADFCCGLNISTLGLLDGLLGSLGTKSGTVLSINLLRGRDSSTNSLRESLWTNYKDQFHPDLSKHRGVFWYLQTLETLAHRIASDTGGPFDCIAQEILERTGRPRFNSYKSTGQVFDSVVWRWPVGAPAHGPLKRYRDRYAAWSETRREMTEAGRRVAWDYDSLLASMCALTAARNKLMRGAA